MRLSKFGVFLYSIPGAIKSCPKSNYLTNPSHLHCSFHGWNHCQKRFGVSIAIDKVTLIHKRPATPESCAKTLIHGLKFSLLPPREYVKELEKQAEARPNIYKARCKESYIVRHK